MAIELLWTPQGSSGEQLTRRKMLRHYPNLSPLAE
jgi:uncharacterized membrane protein